MIEKTRQISEFEKQALTERLAQALIAFPEISFVYMHGSFIKEGRFRDIDLAIFLKEIPVSSLKYELEMEIRLSGIAGRLPVDIRILNGAPLSFRYRVIKEGKPLIVRDNAKMADFIEATVTQYLDFSPHLENYLKETIGLGV